MAARRDEAGRRRRAIEERLGTAVNQRQRCARSVEELSRRRDLLVAPMVALHTETVVRAEFVKILYGGGFAGGNQKEQSKLLPKHAHQKSRKQTPDDPIRRALKTRRGLVQKKISRTKGLPEPDLLEPRH